MSDWKDILLARAKSQGMCRENFLALERCGSKESAIVLYKRTIDWALEESYPGLDVIRQHFSDSEDCGIYVDKDFGEPKEIGDKVAVFHHCNGVIRAGLDVKRAIIPMLYLADGSHLTVEGNGYDVIVPVYLCEGCSVNAKDGIRLKVYHIGKK